MAPTPNSDETDVRRVLGIEGTAWAASAAIYDVVADDVVIETDAYLPDSGGIHPREAAEHMSDAVPAVVETMLAEAREQAAVAGERPETPIDAVAFSRGPGLGPCLRIAGTAARTVAQRFDVPLVGVNHMVAHLEIGRHQSGFDAPVCLNASGANAHVLAYRNGRYRVLGETMDTGVGNAIDKFTRHLGWSHPGGPKVESHAKDGEYVDLPYVVKGMDFSFSGIMSAAKAAVDDVSASSEGRSPSDHSSGRRPREDDASRGSSDRQSDGGTPVDDICRGLEETIFAMLTEVSERALSLTGRDELVLGGGVGQNDRLQGMLREMCEQRGADVYVPEDRFLRDNAGMIAVLGAKMAVAGDTVAVADSAIDADFRPDEVPIAWRDAEPPEATALSDAAMAHQGAEATVEIRGDTVVKRRRPRSYRHPALDERLRRERTRQEARLTSEARRHGVPTPVVHDVDTRETSITLGFVGEADLREGLTERRVRDVGRHLAAIHDAGFVHGDPTTRNVRIDGGDDGRTYLIDFGLGFSTRDAEDYAVDLHVFGRSLAGTADDADALRNVTESAYRETSTQAETVLDRLREVEGRGRYQ